MKRYFFLIALCTATVMCMAQPRPGRGGNHHGNHGSQGRHHHTERVECLGEQQMSMVMATLRNQSFDDKRLEVAKMCVVLVPFCTRDLAEIAELFNFDEMRLTFFQFAYPYCLDPENYMFLRKSFKFESNYNSLMESIRPAR